LWHRRFSDGLPFLFPATYSDVVHRHCCGALAQTGLVEEFNHEIENSWQSKHARNPTDLVTIAGQRNQIKLFPTPNYFVSGSSVPGVALKVPCAPK